MKKRDRGREAPVTSADPDMTRAPDHDMTERASSMILRRIQLAIVAACTLAAPILLATWFGLCPQYGNPQCPTSANVLAALTAFRDADPALMNVFLTVNTVAPYVYPVSYLGLGILAMKRSPFLSTIGIVSGWFGSIAWGFIAAAQFVYYDAARLISATDAASLLGSIYLHWQIYYIVAGGWVIGHLFAYVFLGIALLRARTIPRWASYLIIISAPLMGPIAYGLNNGSLQVAGYALVFVASIPASFSLVRDDPRRRLKIGYR
jgi:hypothetical protein